MREALDVDSKLSAITGSLENIVMDLNAAQERVWSSTGRGSVSGDRGEGSSDDEVGKIVGVFNAHHETLAYLESKAKAVEGDMVMISQMLAKSGQ